jgi:hypothetical protein
MAGAMYVSMDPIPVMMNFSCLSFQNHKKMRAKTKILVKDLTGKENVQLKV